MISRHLGTQDYLSVWRAMQHFTDTRQEDTADELWIVEHFPVYTLGLSGKREHLLNTQDIPVIHTDRGGQVTYHGPGQLIIYTLLDLKRLELNSRQIVTVLEEAMITTLQHYELQAIAKLDAPGVYIKEKKIGSVGLRIKKNRCYHGISLNNAMDLRPFDFINPCGFVGLKMTQLADFNINIDNNELAKPLITAITKALYL